MLRFFKRLFCKHSWKKIAWHEEYDHFRHERYAIRWYECSKCGKIITVDGRYDNIFNRHLE